MNLPAQIEAVLFFKGEAVSYAWLANTLERPEEEVRGAVNELEGSLEERGLSIIYKDERLMLSTDPRVSGLIEKITKEDIAKELGKAGVETLSIILYRGPIAKAEIDYIRGVNSSSILRNLLIKGLVEKRPHPEGKKVTMYEASFDLLAFLGLERVTDLPEYESANAEIDAFKAEEQGAGEAQ